MTWSMLACMWVGAVCLRLTSPARISTSCRRRARRAFGSRPAGRAQRSFAFSERPQGMSDAERKAEERRPIHTGAVPRKSKPPSSRSSTRMDRGMDRAVSRLRGVGIQSRHESLHKSSRVSMACDPGSPWPGRCGVWGHRRCKRT
jgi:hypothetical protein